MLNFLGSNTVLLSDAELVSENLYFFPVNQPCLNICNSVITIKILFSDMNGCFVAWNFRYSDFLLPIILIFVCSMLSSQKNR
jgi:hypothetical protein